MTSGLPLLEPDSADRATSLALETFDIEAAAILGLKARVGASFAQCVRMMLAVQGRVVVTGLGKSGHIGRKLAATFADRKSVV